MKLPAYLAPLRHGPFARYISGEAISMIGTWMQMAVQGWVMTKLTHSAVALAWQYFLSGIPMLLFSLPAGSAADRWDRRYILHTVLLLQMLSALVMGVLLAHGHEDINYFYIAAAFVGVVAAFEMPAVAAFVPDLVPREEMSGAIAIDRSCFHATRLIGPALGGYVVAKFGASNAYFINSLSYLALILALLTIPRVQRLPAPDAAAIATPEAKAESGSILAGLRHVRQDEPSLAMVLVIAAMTCFVSPLLLVFLPLYANHVLSLDPQHFSFLMTGAGLGSFSGSLSLLAIPPGHRAPVMKLGVLAAVLSMLGLAYSHSFWASFVAMIFCSLGLSLNFGLANTVVQERAPDALRGRVSAVVGLSFAGLLPFSGLFLGMLIDFANSRWPQAEAPSWAMRPVLVGCAVVFGTLCTAVLAGRKHLGNDQPPADCPAAEAVTGA